MLRQIEWWVQNGPITKNGVLPVTTLFFKNFVSVPRIKSWFNVPTTQMPIFLPLFVSARILFDGNIFVRVSLNQLWSTFIV